MRSFREEFARDYVFTALKVGTTLAVRKSYVMSNPKEVAGYCRAMTKGLVFTMTNRAAAIHLFWEEFPTAKPANLDDATALSLVKAHLERDGRMNALRLQWLGEFQKVLPGRLAARVIQVDRRISLAQQMEIASQIPLIY